MNVLKYKKQTNFTKNNYTDKILMIKRYFILLKIKVGTWIDTCSRINHTEVGIKAWENILIKNYNIKIKY